MPTPTAPRTRIAEAWLLCRRCLYCAILLVCAWTVLHALVLQEYQIPTGSMAPTLRGNHRVCTCPRCGQEVAIGRHYADTTGSGRARFYRKTFCPNCGLTPLDVTDTDELPGDRVIVNKAAYRVRSPSRWEIVVLRLFGSAYIKRLLGLPGEEILIHDGDLYVNGRLQRKTYAQARRMRVLIFDQDKMPPMTEGKSRWEFDPPRTLDKSRGTGFQSCHLPTGSESCPTNAIHLDGTVTLTTMAYQNLSLESGKCEPLRDEYAYNAGVHADSECVHDFLIETEIEPTGGAGSLALRLYDGHDWVEVHLPIAVPDSTNRVLRVGQRYRVEMAFVDRRMSVTINQQLWHEIDLPEAKQRHGVARPFLMQADGVRATLHSFRLYRDVHYGQQGKQAVHGKMVRLGVDQYFVLGDNSPHSEDSRHWANEGRVSFADLIGPLMWGY